MTTPSIANPAKPLFGRVQGFGAPSLRFGQHQPAPENDEKPAADSIPEDAGDQFAFSDAPQAEGPQALAGEKKPSLLSRVLHSPGRMWENAKFSMAVLFKSVIPMLSSVLFFVNLPMGCLSLPLSFVSGRIGNRIASRVDESQLGAMTQKMNGYWQLLENPEKIMKGLVENGTLSMEALQNPALQTAQQKAAIAGVIQKATNDLLKIDLPILGGGLAWLLKSGAVAPMIQSRLLSRVSTSGMQKVLILPKLAHINNQFANEKFSVALKEGTKAFFQIAPGLMIFKVASMVTGPVGAFLSTAAISLLGKELFDSLKAGKSVHDAHEAVETLEEEATPPAPAAKEPAETVESDPGV
ncbi:MAG: hypothetical protein AB7P76_09635 [Candidatus Melainabacteria bacterium]